MKEWTSPELTVLVRNDPQEMVLTACKTQASGGGVYSIDRNCVEEEMIPCGGQCQSMTAS